MHFTVRTPASSANLGPGFDALGLALGLWNEVTIDTAGEPGHITLDGSEASLLEGRENLALTAMQRLADAVDRPLPPFALTVRTDVPVARGLGSSAAALVAGLVAANHLLDNPLSIEDIFSIAWQMEGHGDNVGAALFGGAVLAVPEMPQPVQLLTHGRLDLCAVVFVPEATGLTRAARAALPPTVPHADAAFNVATSSGLVLGLHTGNARLIGAGMLDRLHQPYRARLFPHLEAMIAAARNAGAIGACLSGAGPSVLALTVPANTDSISLAFQGVAETMNVIGQVQQLMVAPKGAEVFPLNAHPAHTAADEVAATR